MSLDPRVVAIQGIGFTPIQVAVQGLLEFIAGGGKTIFQDTDQGIAPSNQKDYIAENLNRQYERKLRLQRDDMLATEFIAAMLHMEMLDG